MFETAAVDEFVLLSESLKPVLLAPFTVSSLQVDVSVPSVASLTREVRLPKEATHLLHLRPPVHQKLQPYQTFTDTYWRDEIPMSISWVSEELLEAGCSSETVCLPSLTLSSIFGRPRSHGLLSSRNHKPMASHSSMILTGPEIQTIAPPVLSSTVARAPPATRLVCCYPEVALATSKLRHSHTQVVHRPPSHISESSQPWTDGCSNAGSEPEHLDKEKYRRLLAHRGEAAQTRIDNIQQKLFNDTSLESVDKAHRLKALLRLSKASNTLPSTFYLRDIHDRRPVARLSTPSTDIYQGTHDGRKVFLKRYRVYEGSMTQEERAELMNREAIVWANHQHTGVLPFLGVFKQDDGADDCGLYLVSPFFEHGTIVSYLELHPTANRRLLMCDVLGAMTYLHSNDIIHGDIKGVNVLVDSAGRACVSDLGFSRLTSAVVLTWTSVRSVATVATIPWQAPELLKCLLEGGGTGSENRANDLVRPTKEADVYSVGCLAYEVFTNQSPFWDVSPRKPVMRPADIVTAVVTGRKQPTRPEPQSDAYGLCGLTDELWSMMQSCWTREPSLRPSAYQLRELPCFKDLIDDRPQET